MASTISARSRYLKFTRKAGLKFSLCYEDRTIQQEVIGGYISAWAAISHGQQTMLYAQSNYFNDPTYLRRGMAPVLLNFGPQYFKTNGQWRAVFSLLNSTNQPAFFTLDNRAPAAVGAFNWPPMWLSQSSGGTLSPTALNNYLEFISTICCQLAGFYQQCLPAIP